MDLRVFLRTLTCVVGLVAAPLRVSAEAGAADTPEAFYLGKALAFSELAVNNVDDLKTAFNQDVRDGAWRTDVLAVIWTWDAVLAVAEDTDPPPSLASIHDDVLASLRLFVESGDLIEQGMARRSDDLTADGNRTMQQAIDDMSATLKDVQAFLTGEGAVGMTSPSVEPKPTTVNPGPITVQTPASDDGGEAREQVAGDPVIVSGIGTTVSEEFVLPAGRYRVDATLEVMDVSGFICTIYGGGDESELLFNEIIESPQTWTASTIFSVAEAGEFFLEVDNTDGTWQVEFEAL